MYKYISSELYIVLWDVTVLQSVQATRPPHSGAAQKIVPAFELSSSVCPTKKFSLLIPKHSHWSKREFFRPQ